MKHFFKISFLLILVQSYNFTNRLLAQNVIYSTLNSKGIKNVSITIDASMGSILKSGIQVNKNDFVYFAVQNEIDLGKNGGKVYGAGINFISNTVYNNYKKYPTENLGAVVSFIDNRSIELHSAERKRDKTFWIGGNVTCSEKIPDEKWVNDYPSYIPAQFYVSKNTGELIFDINDLESNDNKGNFKIELYVVPYDVHINRNKYFLNTCPMVEPKLEQNIYIDCKQNEWYFEGKCGNIFHGFSNNSYRGNNSFSGSQCVYDSKSHKLILNTDKSGSFDIAYWLYNGDRSSKEAAYLHIILDVLTHYAFEKQNSIYRETKKLDCDSTADNSTLFLFDVSGSMSANNKWQSAKQSALTTLGTIKSQSNAAKLKPSISIRAFDGDCITDPTREVIDFTTDLTAVEDAINNKIPPPDGGTPLPQSIKVSEEKLNAYLIANKIKKGKLIVLTDGVSSCGLLRPQGVYSTGQQTTQPLSFNATSSSSSLIRYYAVGFDIAPGSEAERDLQYWVQSTGGKYLNAQNQNDLTNAFQKFSRVYIPKPIPAIPTSSEKDKTLFSDGLTFINDEVYDKALESYRLYAKANSTDFNGIYNFALMGEANERYKLAIKNYELYLQLNPNATDKIYVNEMLKNLREIAKKYAEYNKKVVKSDLQYLELYFKKIQNGESVALAIEFIGFLKEKYTYYRDLAAIIEVDDRLFKTNANEVFKGLRECVETIKRNPQAWDRDATPVLSRTYLNMERLISSF